MKKNILPLLGIAVVVAILSTGVFYGLFAGKLHSASSDVVGQPIVVAARDLDRGAVLEAGDLKITQFKGTLAGSFTSPEQLNGATLTASVKSNEPFLQERVISKTPRPGAADGLVPSGFRAVSIRISESDGIIAFLHAGTKVDLQAVQERNGLELKTILQNVEVVAVSPQTQPGGGNRGPVSIVTVLTRAEDADLVALADSGSRLRLALRNPLDTRTAANRDLSLRSVFQIDHAEPGKALTSASQVTGRPVQLAIRVLRATDGGVRELAAKLAHPPSGDAVGIDNFAGDFDSGSALRTLAAQHQVEILSERTFSASGGHPARLRMGPAAGQLGLEFWPESRSGNSVNIRVRGEVIKQTNTGAETRRYEASTSSRSAFLVKGLLSEPQDRPTLERMFPGHSWSDGQLLILVTSTEDASLTARTERVR